MSTAINAVYTGTNLAASDANDGYLAVITEGATPTTITKAPVGTGASGILLGPILTVETPSGSNRAPSGNSAATVGKGGEFYVRKTSAPEAADVGKYVDIDDGAGAVPAGAVKTDTTGVFLVTDITGTGANDRLKIYVP